MLTAWLQYSLTVTEDNCTKWQRDLKNVPQKWKCPEGNVIHRGDKEKFWSGGSCELIMQPLKQFTQFHLKLFKGTLSNYRLLNPLLLSRTTFQSRPIRTDKEQQANSLFSPHQHQWNTMLNINYSLYYLIQIIFIQINRNPTKVGTYFWIIMDYRSNW